LTLSAGEAYLHWKDGGAKGSGDESMAKSKVKKARERLDKAVSRLEALSQDRSALTAAQAGELASLKAEREALQDTARTVSERLDSTIAQIKEVLES
jgi:hypothetical protein|tara:strand:+ start:550 stop:840 length:291 start_codon:yes stop_codon:yes gene_type:complete